MAVEPDLITSDGRRLAATLYEPERSNGIVVQINSSAWTPRQYYRSFCEYLAGRGFTALTYDYRGVGDSAGSDPNAQSVYAWGGKDQPAATEFLLARYPDKRLVLVAHSLGGQIVGLSPRASAYRCALLVAVAHGYWKLWPDAKTRWRMAINYYLVVPVSLALFGRVPRFSFGSPLSPRIAGEMCRFGKNPRWLVDERSRPLRPFNAEVRVPLRHITLSDDEVVPPGADLDLEDFFPNAQRARELHPPSDYGVGKVGHFGFFRRSMPKAAWEDAARWLEQNAGV